MPDKRRETPKMSGEPLFSRSYSYTTVCVFPQGDVDEVESGGVAAINLPSGWGGGPGRAGDELVT